MLYIKIGEQKYPIKDFSTFTSQMGNDAIRIVGDVPLANGFLIVDDEDNLISDRSDYIYLLREDDECKEYTKVEDSIVPTESFAMGDIPESSIQRQLNALNQRISDITPYTDSKMAYYGEKEKIFYGVPQGNLTIFFDNYTGEYSVSRAEDRLTVKFPTLAEQTNITVMVQ